MRKKFIAKKRRKKHPIKGRILLLLFGVFLGYQVVSGLLIKAQLKTNNEDFLRAIIQDSNHHILYEKSNHNLFLQATRLLTGIHMDDPKETLEQVFHYEEEEIPVSGTVENKVAADSKEKEVTKYVNDPKPIDIQDPRVYIYNTHQLENYSMKNLEAYNITPNVMMASYLLREKLNAANIPTIVEESSINDFMSLNAWTGNDTYKASREFIKNAQAKYKNLDLLIDLHRDAINKSASTIEIRGTSYAKVLFVIGKNHDHYEKNYSLSEKIDNILKKHYPGISRGILTKTGAGVNGIYNQDMADNVILIECGGYENTIDEVSNTIEALSEALIEYLKEGV